MEVTEYGEGIFTIDNFLSVEECNEFIKKSESIGYEKAEIQTALGSTLSSEVRNNARILFDDNGLAADLFNRILPYIPSTIDYWSPSGLNERFRFYKYNGNQYFKWHVDGSYKRDYFEVSKLTLIIYLNTAYEGGETEFEPFKLTPKSGMALVFPHKIRHQGSQLTSGTKYVLRTDIMYAKP